MKLSTVFLTLTAATPALAHHAAEVDPVSHSLAHLVVPGALSLAFCTLLCGFWVLRRVRVGAG